MVLPHRNGVRSLRHDTCETFVEIPEVWEILVFSIIIQTEAERRRREAGVKQSMKIRLGSCMWVGMYGIWNYLANQGT